MKKNKKIILRKRFTIIELLVVIGVIGILVALLFPVLSKARERGRQATCISNLKQISLALITYKQNNDEGDVGWPSLLIGDYLSTGDILKCPSDANSSDTPPTAWLARIDNDHYETYDRQGNTGVNIDPNSTAIDYDSYFYEFSDAVCDWTLHDDDGNELLTGTYTWADLKHIQLKQGGDSLKPYGEGYDESLFPVIRCYWHINHLKDYSPANFIPNDAAPVMNVGFAGNFFMSRGMWEQGSWSP